MEEFYTAESVHGSCGWKVGPCAWIDAPSFEMCLAL